MPPGDPEQRGAWTVWRQWLRSESVITVAALGAITAAVGYGLIAARVANVEIPGQVLVNVPRRYYLMTGVSVMTGGPLIIATVFCAGWLRCAPRLSRDGGAVPGALAWAGLGAALGLASAVAARWANHALELPSAQLVATSMIAAALVAVVVGAYLRRSLADVTTSRERLSARRVVLAVVLTLSAAVPCAVRVGDARFDDDTLPFSQVVFSGGACAALINPVRPTPARGSDTDGDCQVGGYALGEAGDWVLLAQRGNPCPGAHSEGPQLVALPKSKIQFVVQRAVTPARTRLCRGH